MLSPEASEKSRGTQYAVDQVLKRATKSPELQDVVARLYKSFSHALLDIMDDLPDIKGIYAAEGSELVALIAEEALKHNPLASKRAVLKLRGQMAFREQIEEAGGVFTTQQVAQLLGITPSAVRKRLERGRLLAVPFGEGANYPVWQFDENGVIEHFADIMAMLNTTSPVGMVQFFLTYDEDIGQTPIDALKEGNPRDFEIVKILARQFNQQVAR
jgi:hypothetical protein